MGGMGGMDHGAMADMPGMEGMDHSAMGMAMQNHPASEQNNPLVDMQAMNPVPAGRPWNRPAQQRPPVLTYADLRSTFEDPDGRALAHA